MLASFLLLHQCLDYSDDEEERRAKGQLKQEKRNRMPHEDDSESTNKGKKSKRYGFCLPYIWFTNLSRWRTSVTYLNS